MNHYRNSFTVESFYSVDSHSFQAQLTEHIKKEIASKSKEYILQVDENEYIKYLVDKYTIEPLIIDFSSEFIPEPLKSIESVNNRIYGGKYQTEILTFTIYYNYSGSAVLFKVRPDEFSMTSRQITINEDEMKVSFTFKIDQRNPEIFNRTKDEYQSHAFMNLKNTNKVAENWNKSVQSIVTSSFTSAKQKFIKENDFFAAINVKVDNTTSGVFSAPTIKRKIIPQPSISNRKEFSSEPTMAKVMYEDILNIIYQLGKSMERKPSTYIGKDEEALRDQFLLLLETRYDSTTATGETFNRGGKTDIILKYAIDGSNLFVAECKFWHGSSEFLKAISQLFDRYLTWRDSKTALILFVRNKEFSNIIETIKNDISTHPYFMSENGARGETSLSYIFFIPQDKEKKVFLEIIAFHFDK
ncbi:MAG TPA: hypothetical protein VJ954_07700 [Ignavibacteriaceae bacterium]|nr:hypothetical protein [Ignavibacteriaceae bacterium]